MSGQGNQVPSVNFANLGTLGGMLAAVLEKFLQGVDGMLPATVIAVDATRTFATVQPLIKIVGTDGSETSRGQIASVPILTLGGGNFGLSFPIVAGQRGWILASDRDISLYNQSNAESIPNTFRLHTFESGLFIPDVRGQITVAGGDADNAVWQTLDGAVKIALTPTMVQISPSVKVLDGMGFFGVNPPGSKPSVTGHLSAVSDANAKAVLTSIIAVLTGCGLASDGTT